MPAIVRKSSTNIIESRREILQTISWQVRSSIWSPPTDVYETEGQFVVRVEIAGMRDDNFEVAVENTTLRIAGHRPDHNERRAYHQMEIWFGSFEIAVELPAPVDVERSQAEYKDGFLMITLPKSHSKEIKVEE